jgi:hypothetical protein
MRMAIKQRAVRVESVGHDIHVVPEQGSIHLIRSVPLIRIDLVVKAIHPIPQERVAGILLPSWLQIPLILKLYLLQ